MASLQVLVFHIVWVHEGGRAGGWFAPPLSGGPPDLLHLIWTIYHGLNNLEAFSRQRQLDPTAFL